MQKMSLFILLFLVANCVFSMDVENNKCVLSNVVRPLPREVIGVIVEQCTNGKQWWYLAEKIPFDNKWCHKAGYNDNGQKIVVGFKNSVRFYNIGLREYTESQCPPNWMTQGNLNASAEQMAFIKHDGKKLFGKPMRGGKELSIWNIASCKKLGQYTFPARIYSVVFSSDGNKMVTLPCRGGRRPDAVKLFDLQKKEELARLICSDSPYLAVVNKDGTRVILSSLFKLVEWDICSGKIREMMDKDSTSVMFMQFDPTEENVVIVKFDGSAFVWHISTGSTSKLKPKVRCVKFDPVGKKNIVAALYDHTVRIWNYINGKELMRFWHSHNACAAEFNPQGDGLMTATVEAVYCWRQYKNYTLQQVKLKILLDKWLLIEKPSILIDSVDKLLCDKTLLLADENNELKDLLISFEASDEAKIVRSALLASVLAKIARHGKVERLNKMGFRFV